MGIDIPTKIPRRATHLVNDVSLHVGVVILHVLYASIHDDCRHGHVVFGNLSFVYILYNDDAYNFDYKHRRRRHTCSGVRIVRGDQPPSYFVPNSLFGRVTHTYVFALSFRVWVLSAKIAMHAITRGSASSPPTTKKVAVGLNFRATQAGSYSVHFG